ncbi:flocculation protein FLO11-like protein [Lates japonicus]|uniref:Flocculation protein FLO11-like protein n=1 Tax=Lates japonicus TaxID=270547 RepID=A0AAD3N641_LATJO|nr:flocculation protein FLO11-like protein [Lates japonicus]
MSASWRDDDEEFRVGGVKGGLRAKPRFSFTEVKLLLEAVKRNRYIILRKFNQGVSAETKKQTWAEITNQINGLGENHREVRQIMKKWADLKCDGKRRIAALRGPNGSNLRKKNLGPVERMVHKILMMSPGGDGDSDQDLGEDDDFSKLYTRGLPPNPTHYSYLNLTDASHSLPGGASLDISPLSSPEKELGGDPFHSSSDFDLDLGDDGERTMDFDENDDSVFSSYPSSLPPPTSTSLDPLPDDTLLRPPLINHLPPVIPPPRAQTHPTLSRPERPPAGLLAEDSHGSTVTPDDVRLAGGSNHCSAQGLLEKPAHLAKQLDSPAQIHAMSGWWESQAAAPSALALWDCVMLTGGLETFSGREVICSDLLAQPNISLSPSTDGVPRAELWGFQVFMGSTFSITCSVEPQYPGGSFQLIFTTNDTAQNYTLPAVNHSAHFLFSAADDTHRGDYTCVYHVYVFSNNFSSESQPLSLTVSASLTDLIIRLLVCLLEPDNVRLLGGASRCDGTLHMKQLGEWRPVVHWISEWEQMVAPVVCGQLGCGSEVSTKRRGSSSKHVWRFRLSCVKAHSVLYDGIDSSISLELICSDYLTRPNISFSPCIDGVSEVKEQGLQTTPTEGTTHVHHVSVSSHNFSSESQPLSLTVSASSTHLIIRVFLVLFMTFSAPLVFWCKENTQRRGQRGAGLP